MADEIVTKTSVKTEKVQNNPEAMHDTTPVVVRRTNPVGIVISLTVVGVFVGAMLGYFIGYLAGVHSNFSNGYTNGPLNTQNRNRIRQGGPWGGYNSSDSTNSSDGNSNSMTY